MTVGSFSGFTCVFCGRRFKRRCVAHLKKHGIGSWSEYEEYLKRKGIDGSDEELSNEYITDLSQLQQAVISRANRFLNLAVMKRVKRLNRLLDAMNPIDERLTDPNEIRTMEFPMLLKLSEHLRVHAKEIFDEIRSPENSCSRPNVEVNIQQNAQSIGGSPVQLPSDPRERANLMVQIKRFLAASSEGSKGDGKVV